VIPCILIIVHHCIRDIRRVETRPTLETDQDLGEQLLGMSIVESAALLPTTSRATDGINQRGF
jgi:hypothetical protein